MISPLAYVDAGAKLGANVTVHPFAYIDKNVEIGDNCEIKCSDQPCHDAGRPDCYR
mgnify:CR=1 FL=1